VFALESAARPIFEAIITRADSPRQIGEPNGSENCRKLRKIVSRAREMEHLGTSGRISVEQQRDDG